LSDTPTYNTVSNYRKYEANIVLHACMFQPGFKPINQTITGQPTRAGRPSTSRSMVLHTYNTAHKNEATSKDICAPSLGSLHVQRHLHGSTGAKLFAHKYL